MTVSSASARQTRVDQGQRTVHRCRGVRAVGLAHHHAVHHVDEQQNVGHRPAGVGQPGRLSPRSASKATAWLTPWRGVPGDLGTKGGVVTDADARVLRADGSVIEGLYAAGNNSASVMGRTYPGPGSTLGPAAVFGYLAARHVAAAVPVA